MMQKLYEISKGKQSTLKHIVGDDNYKVIIAWQNNISNEQQEPYNEGNMISAIEKEQSAMSNTKMGSLFLNVNSS